MKKTILTLAILSTVSLLSASAFAEESQYKVTCGVSQGKVMPDGSKRYVYLPSTEQTRSLNTNGPGVKIEINLKTKKGEKILLTAIPTILKPLPEVTHVDMLLAVEFPDSLKSVTSFGGNDIDPESSGVLFSQALLFTTGNDASDYFKAGCKIQK